MKIIAWLVVSIAFSLFLAIRLAFGVQPMPGGTRITWDRQTNDMSYYVWRINPPVTNWNYLGATTNTSFLYTNHIPEGTMFGVTVNQKFGNNLCCVAADVGVAGWPPSVLTTNQLRLIGPVGALILQSQEKLGGLWETVGLFTNTPLRLSADKNRMLRTVKTNLPPPFP